MAQLSDLKLSLSDMSDDEIRDRIIELRKVRRGVRDRMVASRKKPQTRGAKKAKKAPKKKKLEMTPEQAALLLKMLTGKV